jgi:hypothetical protein
MRENCTCGSEGGESGSSSLPLSVAEQCEGANQATIRVDSRLRGNDGELGAE